MLLWQLALNGLGAAGSYVLLALGFAVIYRMLRFVHFGHAIVFVAAPYYVQLMTTGLGLPLHVGLPAAVALSGLSGYALDTVLYRPLRRRYASHLVMMLASMGAYVIMQNLLALAVGNDPMTLRVIAVQLGLNIMGGRMAVLQVWTVGLAGMVVLILSLTIRHTRGGRLLMAIAGNSELAVVAGIDVERGISVAVFVGSICTGLAGILTAYDTAMSPGLGMNALLMGVTAMAVGGRDLILGPACGAVVLGLCQSMVLWKVASQWQGTTAFVILLIVLLAKRKPISSSGM